MFEIKVADGGEVVLSGRLDAAQERKAEVVLDALQAPTVVDLGELDYISSLGLGLLLRTQKRLKASTGSGLTLVRMSPHIHDIFRYSGLTQVFDIRQDGP